MIDIVTIETPELGDRSYLVTDGDAALVVDPQRDIERVLAAAANRGVRITHVAETHIHNDYVSGGLALARATGAAYLVAGEEPVYFEAERTAVFGGDRLCVGSFEVTVSATPGHTPHHLAYVVGPSGGPPTAVLTGGSMLFGSAGRTDLIDPNQTHALTRSQWRSIRGLGALPGAVSVHPTHGFGSFCSGAPAPATDASTIAAEWNVNPGLVLDEDTFVHLMLAGFGPVPSYYRHMAPLNRAGPDAANVFMPSEVGPAELRARLAWGAWVVDLRPRRHFAAAHVPGSVNIEGGPLLATYVGWTLPWGAHVILVGDDPGQVARAQRDLTRIGADRVGAHALAHVATGPGHGVRSYRLATFRDLAAAYTGHRPVVLDVRRPDEWKASHLADAMHIPLYELVARAPEVPQGTEVWVHCAGGFRASIAASLLDNGERELIVVDDDWSAAASHGLHVEQA